LLILTTTVNLLELIGCLYGRATYETLPANQFFAAHHLFCPKVAPSTAVTNRQIRIDFMGSHRGIIWGNDEPKYSKLFIVHIIGVTHYFLSILKNLAADFISNTSKYILAGSRLS
jgi:hypothetical protein